MVIKIVVEVELETKLDPSGRSCRQLVSVSVTSAIQRGSAVPASYVEHVSAQSVKWHRILRREARAPENAITLEKLATYA
jgi:hypothetical protein